MFNTLNNVYEDLQNSGYSFNTLGLNNNLYSFNSIAPEPSAAPPPAPTYSASDVFDRGILAQETFGGKQIDKNGNVLIGRYKDGSLPSGEVAQGASQMLPSTARYAAKKVGIPWNEKRFVTDKDYNKSVGRAWYTYLYNRYGGDIAKATAAYHAGEPNVDSAIKAAKLAGNPATWLDILHTREGQRPGNENYKRYSTKDYVTKVSNYVKKPSIKISPDFELKAPNPVTYNYPSDPSALISLGAQEGDLAFNRDAFKPWVIDQLAQSRNALDINVLGGLVNSSYGSIYDKYLAPKVRIQTLPQPGKKIVQKPIKGITRKISKAN